MTDRISSRLLLLVCLLGRSIVVFSFSRNGIRSRRLRPRISVTATQLRSSNNEQGNPVARSVGEGALETVGTIGRNLSSGQDDLLSNQYFGTPEDSDSIQSIFSLADNRNIFQRSKQQLAKQNQQAEKQVWEALANLESDSTCPCVVCACVRRSIFSLVVFPNLTALSFSLVSVS